MRSLSLMKKAVTTMRLPNTATNAMIVQKNQAAITESLSGGAKADCTIPPVCNVCVALANNDSFVGSGILPV